MAFESPGLELQGGLWSVAASIHASLNLLSAMVILRQPASFSTPIRVAARSVELVPKM